MICPGFQIGHADDPALKSGVTVIMPDKPATAACHVMGGAPGTRETDLLSPEQTVQAVDAVVLSGGSAFGLDAASGVQAWLRDNQRGYPVGQFQVPIVPAAILFDLSNGGNKNWARYPPYRELGYLACESIGQSSTEGSVGAGTGATEARGPGGLGIASAELTDGTIVTAVAVCNAVGSVFMGDTSHFWAAPFEKDNEFGGKGWPSPLPDNIDQVISKGTTTPGSNTTLAVVMTNADLSQAGCQKMAVNAHDGYARAIYPVHTPSDGDLVFAMSSGSHTLNARPLELYAQTGNVVARAIARGVYSANRPI